MIGIRKGFLAKIFTGVVAKRLTLVETITHRSNQHEIQGVKALRVLFGEQDRKEIPATFIWITREQEAMSDFGFISWSNVRKGKRIALSASICSLSSLESRFSKQTRSKPRRFNWSYPVLYMVATVLANKVSSWT